MNWIDSHCHLYADEFKSDRYEVMQRAKHIDIRQILMPNVDLDSFSGMISLTNQNPNFCYPMVGIHPCYIKPDWETQWAALMELFDQHADLPWVAVGETGLDYYWDDKLKMEQQALFRRHMEWAKHKEWPVVVHCRSAFSDVADILEDMQDGQLRGVLHCFTGSLEEGKRIQDLGFYLGIGGVFTYRSSDLAQFIPRLNPELLLLETDAPYLSPVPMRGKRNEPAYMRYVAEAVALAMGIELEELSEQMHKNTRALFRTLPSI